MNSPEIYFDRLGARLAKFSVRNHMKNANQNGTAETTLPSISQLASLAVALTANGRATARDACFAALEMWEAAETVLREKVDADRQLAHLLSVGIFEHADAEFWQHVRDYKGRDIGLEIEARQYSTEDVKQRLFRDKSLSAQVRDRLFLALPKAAKAYGVAYSAGTAPTADSLARPTLNGFTVRWLVSIRQAQLAVSKSRIITLQRRARR